MLKIEYINRVLVLMNEADMTKRDKFDFDGADNSDVVKHVTDVYTSAWRKCLSFVPISWANVSNFGELPYDMNDGSGYLTLPLDWYRLYCFKMQGWQREVYRVAYEGDEIATMQSRQFARGTPLHPVCVECTNNDGIKILRYYSLPRGIKHQIAKALYVPMCKPIDCIKNEVDLELDQRLEDILCHIAASMVYLRFENYNFSKALENEAVLLSHEIMFQQEKPKV